MEALSVTSSRQSLYRRWRDKLGRTKSQPPNAATCERCARISHIIHSELRWNTRLNKAPDVFSDALQLHFDLGVPLWCPFCQLLLDAFQQSHGPISESELNLLAYFVDISPKSNPKPGSWGIAVVQADVEPPTKRTPIKYNYPPLRREYRRQKGLVLPVANGRTLDKQGRVARLIEGEVDYKVLRQYIDKCNASHSKCSLTSSSRVPNMVVVDCESRRIVQIHPEQQYCTLSYVYGEQQAQSSIDSNLHDGKNWPRTFLDAVHVTLSLGYRYLWIDRYCAPTDNPDFRQIQIAMMDRIYEASQVTIVAAAGNDCHAGLPGAGTLPLLPRKRQRQALLNGSHHVLTVPDARSIRSTKWSNRGWTYQEAVLSRRCLVFAPEQAFFICQSDYFAETMPATPQLTLHSDDNLTLQKLFCEATLSSNPFGGTSTSRGAWSPLDLLENHANTYNTRSLTNANDALDAFRGILARSGYWSYWGIPCIPAYRSDHPCRDAEPSDIPIPIFHSLTHFTLGILRGLAWFVVKTGANKVQACNTDTIPSWSWLGRSNSHIHFLCHPEYEPSRRDTCFFGIGDEIEISIPDKDVENDIATEIVWTPLSSFWQNLDLDIRTIPEQDLLLKLDAPVTDVAQVLVSIKSNSGGESERSVVVSYHTGPKRQLRQLIAMMDDEDTLPSLPADISQQAFTNLPWKLVKITSWTHCHFKEIDGLITSPIIAAYLIIAPTASHWCRKGIAITPGYGDGTEEFAGQPIATIAMTPNSTLPAQTTSRIPSLNDDGFQVRSIILG